VFECSNDPKIFVMTLIQEITVTNGLINSAGKPTEIPPTLQELGNLLT
jgi:hypothetical protein